MRNSNLILASLLGLSLFSGCAGHADTSLSGQQLELVSVSAEDIARLPAGKSYEIDLRKAHVVYEIDGSHAHLDVDRINVISAGSSEVSMRDYMTAHRIQVDESDFLLRLAGDPTLLFANEDTGENVASSNHELINRGHSATSVCGGGICGCSGWDECLDMMNGGLCRPGSGWCSGDAYPVCGCTAA